MIFKSEVFLVPLSAQGGQLRVLVKKDATHFAQVLPNCALRNDFYQREAQEFLLRDIFSSVIHAKIDNWIVSQRYNDRIVNVYDRNLLFDNSHSVAIVRAVAIPEEFASEAKGMWVSRQEVFSNESLLSDDCKRFVQDCLDLIPYWVRNSTLSFELLPSIFAIQDLRMLVSILSEQEIDAGNFHRRLKRLDVLHPLVSGQRIHRWEFDWSKAKTLHTEGLIP